MPTIPIPVFFAFLITSLIPKSAETKPIAWEIAVKNITGKLLAQKKSFLWDHE